VNYNKPVKVRGRFGVLLCESGRCWCIVEAVTQKGHYIEREGVHRSREEAVRVALRLAAADEAPAPADSRVRAPRADDNTSEGGYLYDGGEA